MTKLGQNLTEPDNIGVQIIKSKYLKNGKKNEKKKSSSIWKHILYHRKILCKGKQWIVGNVTQIRFWLVGYEMDHLQN